MGVTNSGNISRVSSYLRITKHSYSYCRVLLMGLTTNDECNEVFEVLYINSQLELNNNEDNRNEYSWLITHSLIT